MQLCQAVEGQAENKRFPTILHTNSEDSLVLWPWFGIPEHQNYKQQTLTIQKKNTRDTLDCNAIAYSQLFLVNLPITKIKF